MINREKKPDMSPLKLREACMEYLKRHHNKHSQEMSETEEVTTRFLKKSATLEQINSRLDRSKAFKKITKEQLEGLTRTKVSYDKLTSASRKDFVPLTERKPRKRRDELSSQSDDDRDEDFGNRKKSTGMGSSTVRWRDIQDVQKSVGEIQKKLQKVEKFMDSLSPESRKIRNRLLMDNNFREAPVRAGTLRLQSTFMDKMELDKIKIIEKFSRNLRENELAKNRMIEKMRQEIEELENIEKEKKKAVINSTRTRSLGRQRPVDKPNYVDVNLLHTEAMIEETSDKPIDSKTSVDSHVFRTHSFKNYDKEFKKKKLEDMLVQPEKSELNTSADIKIQDDVVQKTPDTQQQAQIQATQEIPKVQQQDQKVQQTPKRQQTPQKEVGQGKKKKRSIKSEYKDEVIIQNSPIEIVEKPKEVVVVKNMEEPATIVAAEEKLRKKDVPERTQQGLNVQEKEEAASMIPVVQSKQKKTNSGKTKEETVIEKEDKPSEPMEAKELEKFPEKNKALHVQESQEVTPMTPVKEKIRGRNLSQPHASGTNDEGLKTITLIIPKSRRPFHSSERQSTENSEALKDSPLPQPAAGEAAKQIPNNQSQSQSYVNLASFLPKKGKKTNSGDNAERDDIQNQGKFESIKISSNQIEESVIKNQKKTRSSRSKQSENDDRRSL